MSDKWDDPMFHEGRKWGRMEAREIILANLWSEAYENGFHTQEGEPCHAIEFIGKDGLQKIIEGEK